MLFSGTRHNKYSQPEALIEAIRVGESRAIVYLQKKSETFTNGLLRHHMLPDHLLEEVLNDAMIIFIKKIREQSYTLHTAQPSTYYIEIIKKVVSNKTRGRQHSGGEIKESHTQIIDQSTQHYLERKEQIALIAGMLEHIGPPCSDLIRLKYLDGLRDEEIISQQLTPYSTPESLRVKRSDCMKKLKMLAAQSGYNE